MPRRKPRSPARKGGGNTGGKAGATEADEGGGANKVKKAAGIKSLLGASGLLIPRFDSSEASRKDLVEIHNSRRIRWIT